MTRPEPAVYASYLPVPRRDRRFLRVAVPAAMWTMAVVAFLWARAQQPAGRGVWEDGRVRSFVGVYVHTPYPLLAADDRGDGQPGVMLLVRPGKFGVGGSLAEFDGRRVRLEGWLLRRDGRTMIELDPTGVPAPAEDGGATAPPALVPLGQRTVRGEIVDSKCFLGAMKPGAGKTHKACATLCIRGGIPPVLIGFGPDEPTPVYLLRAPDGGPIDPAIFPLIADDAEATGEAFRLGDLLVLTVSPGSVRRLGDGG